MGETRTSAEADRERWPPGCDSETCEIVRRLDWSLTPLGPISGWPVSLKTAAGLVLASRFPMGLMWGPELIRIYNDAYRPLLGPSHPRALGRPAREALPYRWAASEPLYRAVLSGETVYLSEQFCGGSPERADDKRFITICYSPVRREDDTVGGVLVTVVDDTLQVSANRKLQASESRYHMLVESIDEGFCIIEMVFDGEGRPVDYVFLETNPAFALQTGVADARGRRASGLAMACEDWCRIYAQIARTGRAVRFQKRWEALGRWYDLYAFRYGPAELGQVAVLFSDITVQVETEEALAANHLRLQRLSDALERLSKAGSCAEIQDELLRAANLLAGADGVGIVLEAGARFYCEGRRTAHGSGWDGNPNPLVVALANDAVASQETLIHPDLAHDARVSEGRENEAAFRRSAVVVPMGGTKLAGAVVAYWSRRYEPREEEIGVLEVFARATGTALDRQLAADRLRESEQRFRVLVEETAQAVWEADADGRVVVDSPSWRAYTGQTFEEMRGFGWMSVVHSDDKAFAHEQWRLSLATRKPLNAEFRVWRATGECRWTNARAAPLVDEGGRIRKWVGMNIDITDRKRAEQRVREAALHDPLTGLPNRRLMFEYAEHLLAAAKRKHSQGALLFIDLDRFKPVNDMYGHETGDLLLQEVARRLVGCVRREDLVGRLGGDEFVILLPYLEQMADAMSIAESVVRSISQPCRLRNNDVTVSPSIGISLFPQHGAEVDVLVRTADLAMYHAKQRGRGNYSVYAPELEREGDPAWSIEEKLKRALAGGGLLLHYQPVVHIRSGRLIGVEALLRFAAEEDRTIGPDLFIPVAESAGLIGPIGEWVAVEACRQHRVWRSQGLPPVPVAINVSPQQFRLRKFAQQLSEIVRDARLDPRFLQLEVTESTVMDNVPEAIDILNAVRSMGIKVGLDDFGTGYSSLSYLGALPLDKLKIDQSFVRRIEDDQTSRAITEAIIALGRTLSLEVIGEGVESDKTLAYLQAHGCEQGQGFLFGRPMPNEEFERWYSRRLRVH